MTKGTTVRFRADASDVRALKQLSRRLGMPPSGVLRKLVHDRYADFLLDEAYRKKGPKKAAKKTRVS